MPKELLLFWDQNKKVALLELANFTFAFSGMDSGQDVCICRSKALANGQLVPNLLSTFLAIHSALSPHTRATECW